jgi:hypothetical protein
MKMNEPKKVKTLSELIKELERAYKTFGDISVFIYKKSFDYKEIIVDGMYDFNKGTFFTLLKMDENEADVLENDDLQLIACALSDYYLKTKQKIKMMQYQQYQDEEKYFSLRNKINDTYRVAHKLGISW